MRVKMHSHIDTLGKTGADPKEIREEVREVNYTQLVYFENNSVKNDN